jgi:hypothetical protein
LRTRAKPPAEGRDEKDSHVSVATGTIVFDPEAQTRWDPTIVDGLTSLLDKPAVAAQPGASGQWQMLQPAGPPPAPPEGQESVSASNDLLWIGALRHPRSSSLTRSGGLCPVDSPAELTPTTFRSTQRLSTGKSSVSKGKLSSIGQAHSWPTHAGSNRNRTPVSLSFDPEALDGPRAWRNGAGTNPVRCDSAGRTVGQAVLSKNPRLPLPPGSRGSPALRSTQRLSTGVSSRQAITAPGGREPTANDNGSQRS